jgi:hypothetical protein
MSSGATTGCLSCFVALRLFRYAKNVRAETKNARRNVLVRSIDQADHRNHCGHANPTPSSVSMLRSLCAHKLDVAIFTASEKFIDRFAVVAETDGFAVVLEKTTSRRSMQLYQAGPWTGLCGNATSYHTQRSGSELPLERVNPQGSAMDSLQSASAWPAFRSASTAQRGL